MIAGDYYLLGTITNLAGYVFAADPWSGRYLHRVFCSRSASAGDKEYVPRLPALFLELEQRFRDIVFRAKKNIHNRWREFTHRRNS